MRVVTGVGKVLGLMLGEELGGELRIVMRSPEGTTQDQG